MEHTALYLDRDNKVQHCVILVETGSTPDYTEAQSTLEHATASGFQCWLFENQTKHGNFKPFEFQSESEGILFFATRLGDFSINKNGHDLDSTTLIQEVVDTLGL